ncbi:MAG: 4'-phosphopantetheinyl transferase superfamily protein [Acidobacteria bacterium]|nr:4'-phosphopantetheinyl transferase superfamily protein [Acidobacteriota bacterium]
MIEVWRVDLDTAAVPPPSLGEAARAARFARAELARRYLAAHGALRAVLSRFTAKPLEFALLEKGKPYLPLAPEIRFNLSHSHGRALIAVARGIEVGVDIEHLRPVPHYAALVERYFPPGEPEPAGELEFLRRWTQLEALWKARGAGLYGSGMPLEGGWSVAPVDVGAGYAAAIAWEGAALPVTIHDFGEDQ